LPVSGADLSAAHRIYAKALFEAAQEEGKLDLVHGQIDELRTAVTDVPELRALLEDPEVETRAKGDVLARIAQGADERVVNFLRLIAEKGRAAELAEIADELDKLVAAEERILDVELVTAHELSEQEFGRLIGRIEEASGRKVQATRSVDPDLIGGLVLQAGSMRLDASVRGRLERLRHELATARS
jgi:F-type H+-transporting ATPase subunit delta